MTPAARAALPEFQPHPEDDGDLSDVMALWNKDISGSATGGTGGSGNDDGDPGIFDALM